MRRLTTTSTIAAEPAICAQMSVLKKSDCHDAKVVFLFVFGENANDSLKEEFFKKNNRNLIRVFLK